MERPWGCSAVVPAQAACWATYLHLTAAANFGAIEWHAWISRVQEPQRPNYALIDLDPGRDTTWAELLDLARLHRTALEHLGLTARPKITGR